MLIYRGKIDGMRKREYQGQTRWHLQFVQTSETGELKFLEVKVPDKMNVDRFKIGHMVEFPVAYSVVEGDVYFKINDNVAPEEIKVSAKSA